MLARYGQFGQWVFSGLECGNNRPFISAHNAVYTVAGEGDWSQLRLGKVSACEDKTLLSLDNGESSGIVRVERELLSGSMLIVF